MNGEKEVVSARLPPELGAALRAHADAAGESVSDALRRGVLLVLGKCPTCERAWPEAREEAVVPP